MFTLSQSLRSRTLALILLVSIGGCGGDPQTADSSGPREVDIVTTKAEIFEHVTELPGRIEPVRVAEVRAQVAGIVLKRYFDEGADVKAGQLLFLIDPAPFKAELAQAQGELAKAEAALFHAQSTVKRYTPLVEHQAISEHEFDTAKAALLSAKAEQRAAQALVERAQLNLNYATVRAPISGRIGRALVTEGALVGQGDATMMARIQQLDPIYADFIQPAADALQMRSALAAHKQGNAAYNLSLRVDGTDHKAQGNLVFTDISVDPSTGQLSLRATFPNPDAALLPGMYVLVGLPQAKGHKSIFIPQRAITRSADGQAHVLLINSQGTVEQRAVQTGVMQDSRWQISAGLNEGEQVIVGAMNGLNPGDAVVAKQPTNSPATTH